MNDSLVVALLVSGLLYGTPLILAALGELLTERSGVLNLGVEGMMLMGAVSGFGVSQHVGGPAPVALLLAVLAAAAVGALMAVIHAFVTITLKGNQIVSGLALTILGGALGLSSYIGNAGGLGGEPARHQLAPLNLFGLQDVPVVGPVLFDQNALAYLSWFLVGAVWFYLSRTRPGLHLRAVGEDPRAADAMGVSVTRYRYAHTLTGGAFAGIAGAAFSLAIIPGWTDGMTAGAGWIAIALVIFGFWRPVPILVGAYLFGIVTSLGFNLQARGVDLPLEVFSSLPYVLTIIALVIVSNTWHRGRLGMPQALGTPYSREDD